MKNSILSKSMLLLALLTASVGIPHAFAEVVLTQTDIMVISSGERMTISISGPNNYAYRDTITGNGSGVNLGNVAIGTDGVYIYEVKTISYGAEQTVKNDANGRGNVTVRTVNSVDVITGSYTVVNGLIIVDDGTPES